MNRRSPRRIGVDPPDPKNGRSAEPSDVRLPADLRAELRRLLAAILVMDYREEQQQKQGVSEATVQSPEGLDRGSEGDDDR
jgi:hypothetical protein